MAPYIAVFVSTTGQQVIAGLHTTEEFLARCAVQGTLWGTLLETATGQVCNHKLIKLPESEKTP